MVHRNLKGGKRRLPSARPRSRRYRLLNRYDLMQFSMLTTRSIRRRMTTGKLWGFGVRDMPERDGLMAEGDDCRFFRSEREGFETYSGSGGSPLRRAYAAHGLFGEMFFILNQSKSATCIGAQASRSVWCLRSGRPSCRRVRMAQRGHVVRRDPLRVIAMGEYTR